MYTVFSHPWLSVLTDHDDFLFTSYDKVSLGLDFPQVTFAALWDAPPNFFFLLLCQVGTSYAMRLSLGLSAKTHHKAFPLYYFCTILGAG